MDSPAQQTPVLRSRPSATGLSNIDRSWSFEERGGLCPDTDDSSFASSPPTVPPSPKFWEAEQKPRMGRSQLLLILVLLGAALMSWWPAVKYWWRSSRVREEQPMIFIFHEPQCAGESIALRRSSDLCDLRYPSGIDAKDNVASVMLTHHGTDESSRLAVDVYGTCVLAEQPADPMLIETVTEAGCSDLKEQGLPLQGHLHLRTGPRDAQVGTGVGEL
jgi:hypothetical protein